MKQDKKVVILEKQSKLLKQRISDLENANKMIVAENQSLKETIASRQAQLIQKEQEVERMKKHYEEGLQELRELRFQYNEAAIKAEILCKEYEKEARDLIKRIRATN